MSTDQPAALRALLAFYAEAGADTALDDAPGNRFPAEAPDPRPASASAPARASSHELYQAKRTPGTAGVSSASSQGRAGRPRSQGGPAVPPQRPQAAAGSAPPPPEQAI